MLKPINFEMGRKGEHKIVEQIKSLRSKSLIKLLCEQDTYTLDNGAAFLNVEESENIISVIISCVSAA